MSDTIVAFTQYGLWGEDKLVVPKKHLPTIPDWANVALSGWRKGWQKWLRFWGLERIRRAHHFNNGIDSPVAGSVPGFIERQAMRNLSEQAGLLCVAKGVTKLTVIEKTLIALERYYLTHYERREFPLTYAQFCIQFLPTGDNNQPIKLQDTHRYLWIADRMGMYRHATIETRRGGQTLPITQHWPAAHEIISMLDVASARLELLENRGLAHDMEIDIHSVLRVQKRRAA